MIDIMRNIVKKHANVYLIWGKAVLPNLAWLWVIWECSTLKFSNIERESILSVKYQPSLTPFSIVSLLDLQKNIWHSILDYMALSDTWDTSINTTRDKASGIFLPRTQAPFTSLLFLFRYVVVTNLLDLLLSIKH